MERYWRKLLYILVLAAFWAASGYALGMAFESFFRTGYPVENVFASLNLILGMSLFLGVTRDPTAERIFFEGPRPDEPGRLEVGCLWLLPLSLLVIELWMWVVALLMRLIFPY